MQRFFSFVGGILLGSVIAGTVTLLFAPRSGEETRRYLSERSGEIRDRASDISERATGQVQGMREQMNQQTQEFTVRPMGEGTTH